MAFNLLRPSITLATMLAAVTIASADDHDWKLTWADEFDAPAGTLPDESKWTMETGGGGWGNNELQTYTDRPENASHDGDGNLVITARKETFIGEDGIEREYTSARLITQNKFSQTYGRFEARIALPGGQGVWPAFWMLGDDFATEGWPYCGEIDIMEHVGHATGTVHGTVHGPGYSAADGIGGAYTLPDGKTFTGEFHVFAVEWTPDRIEWSVDGNVYFTLTPDNLGDRRWVFDDPHFLLLNVAVGGHWPGAPDETTPFPAELKIDYVRVYERVEEK